MGTVAGDILNTGADRSPIPVTGNRAVRTARNRNRLLVAGTLSIATHAVLAVYLGQFPLLTAKQPGTDWQLQVRLAAAPVPVAPAARPPPEPAPSAQSPRPTTARPQPAHTPVRQRPTPARRMIATAAPPTPPMATQAAVALPTEPPAAGPAPRVDEREHYLQRLLAHIERHKFYPRNARRRGTEGEVKVAFELQADGGIGDLRITGASKVLRQAARQALQQARPLPPAPASFAGPVRFAMAYRLDP